MTVAGCGAADQPDPAPQDDASVIFDMEAPDAQSQEQPADKPDVGVEQD